MPTNSEHNSEYISIKEVKNVFVAKLNHFNIIEVDLNNANLEVEKKHLELLKQAIKELGGGKKMRLYFKGSDFLGITNEARTYAALPESAEFTLGNAVLIKSLASRILFNFFLNVNKPVVVTKGFTSKEDAFTWLMSLK